MPGAGPSRAIYVSAALVLLVIEVVIALFVRDGFVRGYVGDILAVTFVYAMLRAATTRGVGTSLVATLIIAFVIELAQAADLLSMVGLVDNAVARIVFGGVFDVLDLAAYLAGAAIVVMIEMGVRSRALR